MEFEIILKRQQPYQRGKTAECYQLVFKVERRVSAGLQKTEMCPDKNKMNVMIDFKNIKNLNY